MTRQFWLEKRDGVPVFGLKLKDEGKKATLQDLGNFESVDVFWLRKGESEVTLELGGGLELVM